MKMLQTQKATSITAPNAGKQGGWTIVEIMIGAGLAISLALVAFSNFGDVAATKAQTDGLAEIQDIRSKVKSFRSSRAQRGSTSSPVSVTITDMIAQGITIGRMTDGINQNAYGKTIGVVAATGGADWSMTYATSGEPACKYFLNALANEPVITASACDSDGIFTATFD